MVRTIRAKFSRGVFEPLEPADAGMVREAQEVLNPIRDTAGGWKDLIDGVTVLPLDEGICDRFGLERGRLRQERLTVGDFDLLIAATCLCHGLTLCSNNRHHFEMVEGLEIVSVA